MARKEFEVHKLSEEGLAVASSIGRQFEDLLESLESLSLDARCLAIVSTKLEEACFFAKKGFALVHNDD
jgi:hypothetical protein